VIEDSMLSERIGPAERRCLPFWSHLNMYVRFLLDMDTRIDLTRSTVPGLDLREGDDARWNSSVMLTEIPHLWVWSV
jgi:hypothetical protein